MNEIKCDGYPSCIATLSAINQRLVSIDSRQEELHDGLKELNTKLFVGNGTPSFSTRVDRLEQKQSRRDTHFFVVYGAVITALAISVVGAIFAYRSEINQSTTITRSAE